MMALAEMPVENVEADLKEPFIRLSRDLKKASTNLTRRDARWLVDMYYTIQDERIRSASQMRTSAESGEPHQLIGWVFLGFDKFEAGIKAALGEFAKTYAVGQWLQSQYGIGPVLSAAMLSNFDIRKAQTVGHFWRFAGMDPTCKWEKGQKRPWNARLKSICIYKMGESFVKFQNRNACHYGKLFAAKKAEIFDKNQRGEYGDVAAAEIAAKGAKMKGTQRLEHWQQGRIAPAHVHDRARRWTVKLFLSNLHEVMFWDFFGQAPPAPYVFEHPELGDHRHKLEPPNWPDKERFSGRALKDMID